MASGPRADADEPESPRQSPGGGPPAGSRGDAEQLLSRLDLVGDMVFLLEAETGRIREYTASVGRHLGVEPDALRGRTLTELLPGPAATEVTAFLSAWSDEDAGALRLATTLPGEAGSSLPVSLTVTCIPAGGSRLAVITARSQGRPAADEVQRRDGEHYRQLAEQSGDGLFLADADGRYLDVNPAGCKMLGYTRDELQALTISDVVMPEEQGRVAPEIAHLALGRRVRREWRFRRKDGSSFDGEVVACLLAGGRILALVRDVSERRAMEDCLRQAEERSRIALNAAALGTWTYEFESGGIRLDPRCRGYLGGLSEQVPPSAVLERVQVDDKSRVSAAAAALLESLRPPGNLTLEFRVADGDIGLRWLRANTHVQFVGASGQRRPLRIIGTLADVTRGKRIEQRMMRLSRAYETLSQINKGIARADSEMELLMAACATAARQPGLRLVRIVPLGEGRGTGLVQAGPALSADDGRPVYAGSNEAGDLADLLCCRRYYCSTTPDRDVSLGSWQAFCTEAAIGGMGIFPLNVGGETVYAMCFFAAHADDIDATMVRLLDEMATDVSVGLDRLAAGRRAQDAQRLYATLFRRSPICVLTVSLRDHRVLDANDAFLENFDYQMMELVGRPLAEVDMWQGIAETMAGLLEGDGRVREHEARLRRRDGQMRECLVSGEVILLGDERRLLCIINDVSDRRRAERQVRLKEQELRSLVESSPDIILRFDCQCRGVYGNPEALRVLGLTQADVLGHTPTELIPGRDFANRLEDALARVVATGSERRISLEILEAPVWSPVQRDFQLLPEPGADGRPATVLAVGRNISRIRDTEQRLEEMQDKLRVLSVRREAAREDERKRMAREIHDVLGQLLTALRLDIDMLGMEFGTDEPMLLERTARTTELVDRTIAIVRDLASTLRPSALDMGIASALEWAAREFSKRTGVPCSVLVNEGEVQLQEMQAVAVFRLVQECLTNIARHARASQVDVLLIRAEEGYWLSVSDDGIGFDAVTADPTSLGLVGMRERAMGLGGDLLIQSAPGKGTRIEVAFPATTPGEIQ